MTFTVGKFMARRVTVEAMQLKGTQEDLNVAGWVESLTQGWFEPEIGGTMPLSGVAVDPDDGCMILATLNGLVRVETGDWVVRGVAGEFFKVSKEMFDSLYTPTWSDGSVIPGAM